MAVEVVGEHEPQRLKPEARVDHVAEAVHVRLAHAERLDGHPPDLHAELGDHGLDHVAEDEVARHQGEHPHPGLQPQSRDHVVRVLEEELLPDGLVYPRLQVPLVLDPVVLAGKAEVLDREVGILSLEVEPEGLGEREVEVHAVQLAPPRFCRSRVKM
ncbi:MAG: hypothetical protein IKG18_15305 [Atopobiaceae bacterium]|nr:hypothetical protein [Atopobiaceae bacterium]